jgi:hypothetical protein
MTKLAFKKLTIEDKNMFDKYFSNCHPEASEYTFTNLFVWRNSRSIEYALYEEGLIILAESDNKKYFMQPFGFKDQKKAIDFIINYGLKNNITNTIKRLDEKSIQLIKDTGLKIIEDIDNFDYVYNADDLAFLKGRKYSNKRGFIKKFYAEYYHKYWKVGKKCIPKCIDLAEKWMKSRENDPSVVNEYKAIIELMENYDKLDAVGGLICCDEKVIAFEFGEKLNKDTFVIHFEKGDADYLGVYQTINKMFVENEIDGKYKFVNREQDLGIPGIRQAKQSYYPAKMIKKYTVTA